MEIAAAAIQRQTAAGIMEIFVKHSGIKLMVVSESENIDTKCS